VNPWKISAKERDIPSLTDTFPAGNCWRKTRYSRMKSRKTMWRTRWWKAKMRNPPYQISTAGTSCLNPPKKAGKHSYKHSKTPTFWSTPTKPPTASEKPPSPTKIAVLISPRNYPIAHQKRERSINCPAKYWMPLLSRMTTILIWSTGLPRAY